MSNEGDAPEQRRLPDFEDRGTAAEPGVTTMPATAEDQSDPRVVGGPAPAGDARNPGIPTMSAPSAAASPGNGPRPAGVGLGTTQVDDPEQLREAGSGARELAGKLKTHGDRGGGALGVVVQSFLDKDWSGELGGAIVTA